MLEEAKIQAGMRSVANKDRLLMCRSYKCFQMQRLTLPTPYWHCLLLRPSPQSDFFKTTTTRRKITQPKRNSTAVQTGSHLLDLPPLKCCPMEAVGAKCSFGSEI